ncbi:MAG: exosortase F system-associated membrane protein [Cyclobacteriaceae bacterium]
MLMIAGALLGLLLVFLFQRIEIATALGVQDNMWKFVTNRSIRFILNDLLSLLLIYGLFPQRKYVLFAIGVQVFGSVFILLPYFILKFEYPSYNGPLISFLHRLVLNPLLMLLLIPAFYLQNENAGKNHGHG